MLSFNLTVSVSLRRLLRELQKEHSVRRRMWDKKNVQNQWLRHGLIYEEFLLATVQERKTVGIFAQPTRKGTS